jgi:hypothetical protein
MKTPDSIQAIPEVQRTFYIFNSTCRRGEHVEQLNEKEKENESAAADAEWAVPWFVSSQTKRFGLDAR